MADSGEMLDEVRSQVFDDRVYVFTPKGDVVDLPAGSTPLDFAYHIHSDVGHRCIGAKIGGRIVPFTYQLQMGDQIEIITQKQPNPSRDWLNPNLGYVTTSRGRSKIHARFRKQDRDKNILAGRQILDDELSHLGISLKEAEKHLLPRYNFNELEELLAAIGGGDIRLNQMVNFLQSQFNKPSAAEEDAAALKQLQQKTHTPQNRRKDNGRVVVEGVGNLMHHIARCCQPIPGDEIVGFITGVAGFPFIGRTVSNWSNCVRMRRNALWMPSGAKPTRRDTRWWYVYRPTIAAAYCAISRRFWRTRRLTCLALPAVVIPNSSLPPST